MANQNQPNSHYNAQVIFDAQLRRKAWGMKNNGKNFMNMKKGDIVLLYVGRPYCAFAGYAVLGESPRLFTKSEQNKFLDKVYRRKPKAGVKFSSVKRFNVQVPVTLLVPELKFIRNKKNWGMYFQGSAVGLDALSFHKVLAVACMLNKSLEKALKPRMRSQINAIFKPEQLTLH